MFLRCTIVLWLLGCLVSCGYPENNEIKTIYNISCFDSEYFLKKYNIEYAYKYYDAIVYASKDSKISKESYPHFSVGLFSSDVADVSYMLRDSYMKLNTDSPPYTSSGFDVLSNEFLKETSECNEHYIYDLHDGNDLLESFFLNKSANVVNIFFDARRGVMVGVHDEDYRSFDMVLKHPDNEYVITGFVQRKSEEK